MRRLHCCDHPDEDRNKHYDGNRVVADLDHLGEKNTRMLAYGAQIAEDPPIERHKPAGLLKEVQRVPPDSFKDVANAMGWQRSNRHDRVTLLVGQMY
jgi:hypothetical protein